MIKAGIITGRVRDPNRQPVPGIVVSATRTSYYNGRPQLNSVISKPTDDRGVFRIFWVSPGEYFVDATPRVATGVPGPQDSWARTFFPGVADPNTATSLVVKDGAEIEGIDFSMQSLSSTATFKISGKVINPLVVPNSTAGTVSNLLGFTLQPRELGILDSATTPGIRQTVGPNGEFEIRKVRPGSYDLFVAYQLPRPLPGAPPPSGTPAATPAPLLLTRFYIDRAPVDIRDSDVEGITLQIQPGTELRGNVVGQGSTSIAMDKIRIRLRQLDSMPEGYAVIVGEISVDSNGEFSTQNVPSARYALRFSGLPETAYVADVRQGGTTVFDSGFTLGNQPGTMIEVLVNSNGALIEGSVQAADKKPSANASVVLVPPASHRQNALLYKTVQTDENGRFSLKGVAPGEYTLYAWANVPSTAWMNSDFLAKYQNRGRAVVVSQGNRLEAQLELIPDDINRR
jgi:sarcosine oxidase gamma subunit